MLEFLDKQELFAPSGSYNAAQESIFPAYQVSRPLGVYKPAFVCIREPERGLERAYEQILSALQKNIHRGRSPSVWKR
jgi:hypothetical protein